jgi:hypothetical protein
MAGDDCQLLAEIFLNENPASCSPKKMAFADAHFRECEHCRTRFAQMGNLSDWQDKWGNLNKDDTKGLGILIAVTVALFAGAIAVWYYMR